DFTDRVHSDLADFDPGFGVTGADPVELLIFLLEAGLDLSQALWIEAIETDRHLHTGALAPVTHGKIPAEVYLVWSESLTDHRLGHFFFDPFQPVIDDFGIGRHHILATEHAGANHVGCGGTESGKHRRGGEDVYFLDAQLGGKTRGVHRSGAAEG